MSNSRLCRICSARNEKLISLKNKNLIECYESLTTRKIYCKDDRPKGFCDTCYLGLLRVYEFYQKISRLHKISTMLAERGLEGTSENIARCEAEVKEIPLEEGEEIITTRGHA